MRTSIGQRQRPESMAVVCLGLCLLLVALVCPACSEDEKQKEPQVTEKNIMDRPEIIGALFHPSREPRQPTPAGAVDIDVPVADGVSLGCRLFANAATAPTLIYFHGNAETVPDYNDIGPYYVAEGLNVLFTDYRGYGWSTGRPLTSTFLADSNQLFLGLKEWLAGHGFTGPLFVMGRSLGSASAIEVAVNHSDAVTGLIIESGFARTLPLARVLGVDLEALGIVEEQTFDNGGKIAKFTKPTFILHGQRDTLIPLWQVETLMAASGAKSKELQIVPGADHNTLIAIAGRLYFQAIRIFVEKAAGTAPDWRERRKRFKEQQAQQGS